MLERQTSDLPVLRFAIAGLGAAGCMMIPAVVKHPGLKMAAAADLDPEPLEKFRQDFQAETFLSVEDLCSSPNVDAVYIATPTQLHAQHVLTALDRGKHVIIEKPMALTLNDAESMITAAQRNGVHLVVGHSHSFETPIRRIREIVRSGELGRLRMIHNWYFTDWIYRPRNREELDTSLGGGVTFRQGSHQFDIIRIVGGGMLRSVRAMTGRWDASRPTEGSHVVYLEFEDGTPATAVYSGYDRFRTAELTYSVGEQGQLVNLSAYAAGRKAQRTIGDAAAESAFKRSTVRYGGARRRESGPPNPHPPFYGMTVASCEKGDIRQSADGLLIYGEDEIQEIPLPTDRSGRDAVVAELYDAVAKDIPPVHGGRWGKANLEVCLSVLESARERREVILSHQVATPD